MRVVDRRDDVRAVLSVEDHASERWISGSHFREARIVVTDCPMRNRRNAQNTKPQTRLLLNAGLKNSAVRRLRVVYAVTKHQPRRRRHSRRACGRHPRRPRRRGSRRARSSRVKAARRLGRRAGRRAKTPSRSLLQKFCARRSGFRLRCASPARDPVGGRLETPPRGATPASRSARGVSSRASRFPASKPLDALARSLPARFVRRRLFSTTSTARLLRKSVLRPNPP